MAKADPLATYHAKRRFDETPEPRGRKVADGGHLYTIQKHDARRLHYDLRLELDGVLKSWAITRGPSLDPAEKRLAVRTEDHPVDYAQFEGTIPDGSYGAGTVILWDRGNWTPVGDPHEGLDKGKLVFELHGERLHGRFALVRFRGKGGEKRENWLLVKELDDEVDRDLDVLEEFPDSVATGRSLDEVASGKAASRAKRATTPRLDEKRRPETAEAGLDRFVEPALATLVSEVPTGADWLFEVKFDGYRLMAAVHGEQVRLLTRTGQDWTHRFERIARALRGLGLDDALLDGEVIVADADGRSDFGALQRSMEEGADRVSYFAFDLLVDDGADVRERPLVERKARLAEILAAGGGKGPVYYTDDLRGDGRKLLDTLCGKGFEGVIAKRADAPYRSGRRDDWLKIKCGHRQEFIVVGWSPSDKDRAFASLLVGLRTPDGGLRYAGRVGSGFSEEVLADLSARLHALAIKDAPVPDVPAAIGRVARWVRPELVVEVAFAGFTRDGLVRHGRFLGRREDKPTEAVVREEPRPMTKPASAADEVELAGVRLTHPNRVLYGDLGLTKLDLARYYDALAERMLPYVANRLVSFVRCPQGAEQSCFFQRHAGTGTPRVFKRLAVEEKSQREDYLYLTDRKGLITAAQMGVLELHVWGSRVDRVEQPDRLVFDLDPDEGLGFAEVVEAAGELRQVLEALDLVTWPMVTGGKGVHVVVPIQRDHGWDTMAAFCKAVAERLAEAQPDRYVATMSKAKRRGRIFIDHFRNDRAATAIAPYSTRSRAGAPVACPVGWDELAGLDAANRFRANDPDAILARPDPWAGYAGNRQKLKAAALRAIGVE